MPAPVHVTTEYGTLQRVAMRYAGEFTRPLDGPDVHPVLDRQRATSTWRPFDPAKVRTQQDLLITLLREHGTEVLLLPDAPGCSTRHYPRDIAFAVDHVLIAARLNSAHRQPETHALYDLAADLPLVVRLDSGTIEGGDVMLHDGSVLVGMSEESTRDGATALQRALHRFQVDREVIPVYFAGSGIVHLDDHFVIVAPDLALIHRDAFPAAQQRFFEKRFDLIDATAAEARTVQVNVLAIAPGRVVVADGSDRIAGQLAARGVEVLSVDYSEVTKIPGSLRCTTLPLNRT